MARSSLCEHPFQTDSGLTFTPRHGRPTLQSNYVGVSPDVFSRGLACGRCIRVQCDDLACKPLGGSLVAQVVDLCGEAQCGGHSRRSMRGCGPAGQPSASCCEPSAFP